MRLADAHALEVVSDAVDEGMSYSSQLTTSDANIFAAFSVNKLKGSQHQQRAWDEDSEFDKQKDKEQFRQYEAACDRVKNFYKEQHGESMSNFFMTVFLNS